MFHLMSNDKQRVLRRTVRFNLTIVSIYQQVIALTFMAIAITI